MSTAKVEQAILGGGCFWCLEAVFQDLNGVLAVESGYAGGRTANPSYREVCSGATGHAEVVRVTFDPAVISYGELLAVFFAFHDPTTRNRQGEDVGTQYRSVILYLSPEQKATAMEMIAGLTAEHVFANPIVTEVVPAGDFWPAEEYHQNYYRNNPNEGYCQLVVAPKVAKLRRSFAHKLRGGS